MGKDLVDLTLFRESAEEPWGFRLAGGKDYGQPLSISQVSKDSLASKVGLSANDFLISIAGKEVFEMTHEQAEKTILEAGNKFSMVIERIDETGRKISFEKSATTFQLKLKGSGGVAGVQKKDEAFISNVPITEDTPMLIDGSVNFKKFEKKMADLSASKTLEDVRANQKKDWNTPWVKKDGSGLKQAMRYVDEPNSRARTSCKHYYSEPKSILGDGKELTREELEAIIKEHGQESRPESRMSQGSRPQSRTQKQQMSGEMYQEEATMEMQEQQMRMEEHQIQMEREEKSLVHREHKEQRVNFVADEQDTYFREREEDSQAPPDLEPVEVQQGFQLGGSMGQFGDEGYEPSADELIDVLKNLENLAAGNPSLYRSIVDQIKGSTQSFEQTQQHSTSAYNGNSQQYEQEMYEQQVYQQQQQEAEMYQMQLEQQQMQMEMQQQMQQQMYEEQMSQQTTITQETSSSHQQISQQQSFSQQQQVEEQMAKMNMSEEEFKQHQKMKRLEAEAQEEVRQTLAAQREAKMRKLHPPEPPKPKEIMVIAGDGKQVKVQLGGEAQEDSRKQVAEAAGLKHVPLPDFDATEQSAWAGSLKKTTKTKITQGRQEAIDDENPWAGSLRHVTDKPRKGQKKDNSDDLYGGAPWMGTLRHVVHDNKVTRNYGVNQHQSKRYPDEDAGNPFEATQGSNAKPAFPLTPAAIINGAVMSRDEMARREEEEEVARIRSNIGSKTVSTALLQVLMPKLLKMHETKYPPMEKADAEKIMEEILGMQCGLNPDQQADANEEAEMIIRAIMQDEVDKSIYSKMADDLEAASKRMKKMKKVKKVKDSAAEITA